MPASHRIPAGRPDFIGLTSLVDVEIRAGIAVTYDGRPAVVCVPPIENPRWLGMTDVLIRYLDGNRERVLVTPYECSVGVEW